MFQKERKSFWEVFLYGFFGAIITVVVSIFFVTLMVILPCHSEFVLVLIVIGFGLGLAVTLGSESKIRFDGDKASLKLCLKTKTKYNSVFIGFLAFRLEELGPVTMREFMSFLLNILFGYYRGEKTRKGSSLGPTWGEFEKVAELLLAGPTDSKELVEQAKNWIRDRKREDIR